MTAQFVLPKPYLADDAGDPVLGGKLNFYEIGTSTRKNTYIDASLSAAHPNPIIGDAFGVFPQIWLDTSTTDYRVVVTDQFDVEYYTIDGLLDQQTPTDLLNDIKTVDGSGSGLDADTLDGLDSTDFVNVAESQTITGLKDFTDHPTINSIPIGFLDIPLIDAAAQVELRQGYNGKAICSTTGGLLIPVTSDFPFEIGPFRRGHVTLFMNDSVSNQQITAETPATTILHLGATATTGTRTVAPHGIAVCWYYKDNNWVIYGTGVT